MTLIKRTMQKRRIYLSGSRQSIIDPNPERERMDPKQVQRII